MTVRTPPQVAKLLLVKPGKVVGWIDSGELEAFNVANAGSKRPRWRITQEALDDFLRRRASRPASPKPARRRQRRTPDVIEFFK